MIRPAEPLRQHCGICGEYTPSVVIDGITLCEHWDDDDHDIDIYDEVDEVDEVDE